MNARQLLISSASALTLTFSAPAPAQEAQARYVRLAELEIDPAQLERFHVAIKEGIAAAIRLEPGVLVLYAVAEKESLGPSAPPGKARRGTSALTPGFRAC